MTYQTKVGEDEVKELIDKFNVKQDFAGQCVIRVPDLLRVKDRVDCGEEGTVQPATTLRDKLRHRICNSSVT